MSTSYVTPCTHSALIVRNRDSSRSLTSPTFQYHVQSELSAMQRSGPGWLQARACELAGGEARQAQLGRGESYLLELSKISEACPH